MKSKRKSIENSLSLIALIMLVIIVLAACNNGEKVATEENSTQTSENNTQTSEEDTESMLSLTASELGAFNGKDGNPAYIAIDGVIYDVTDVTMWSGGDHNGFEAGQDLTEEIKNISPHGVSKLKGLTVVGELIVD